jgi:hypothetical protein
MNAGISWVSSKKPVTEDSSATHSEHARILEESSRVPGIHMDCGSLLPLCDASLLARTSFPFVHISPFGGSRAAFPKAAAGCRSPKTSSLL